VNQEHVHTPTSEQQAELRDRVESWLVSVSQNNNEWKFHIPNGDGRAVCQTAREMSVGALEEKPVGVYPRGWRPVCAYCWTVYDRGDRGAE